MLVSVFYGSENHLRPLKHRILINKFNIFEFVQSIKESLLIIIFTIYILISKNPTIEVFDVRVFMIGVVKPVDP